SHCSHFFFVYQAEDGIRDFHVTGVQTCALPIFAKPARMKPRDIAELIAEKLRGHDAFTQVEVAGPGFLNLTVAARIWQQLVSSILKQGKDYGRTSIGQGQRVNVEYVSANPTGPMHVGHCRGAVFGDTLCNLLEFAGYEVTREYY